MIARVGCLEHDMIQGGRHPSFIDICILNDRAVQTIALQIRAYVVSRSFNQ